MAIICEVDSPKKGRFVIKSNEDRPYAQIAFVGEALNILERQRELVEEAAAQEEDDDG